MALIRRMSRLFTADLHAVLDQIEEPEILLKQAVREMEEELARQEQRIKWLRHERELVIAREGELKSAPAEIDEQLDLCFADGNEELARKLTRRKLQTQRLAQRLSAKREIADKALADNEANLAENRERLEGMRQKAECLAEELGDAHTERSFANAEWAVAEDEVEIAYLREKQRRSKS